MPLVQTKYGGECPLGKFEIDVPAGGGCYTSDPVEACLLCNFAGSYIPKSGFDPAKICKCPVDMTLPEYKRLTEAYTLAYPNKSGRSKKVFQEFVRESHTSLDSRITASPSE